MTDHQQRVVFAPDVVLQVIDGEALVLRLSDETAFALNETGTRIAQLIGAGTEMPVLIDLLAAQYQRDRSEVERDVNDLVRVLVSKRLVVHSPPEKMEKMDRSDESSE
jgi:hypothetical protein